MQENKSKITDPERILTLANFISLLRVILVIPIIYYIQVPDKKLILVLLVILVIASDMLDGFIARRAHEVTHIGMWLDPLADSIVIVSITFYLVMAGLFPMWFFVFFMVRYLSISLPGVYLINHSDIKNSANIPGKWATAAVSIMLVLHIFQIPSLEFIMDLSLWISFGLLLISWALYMKEYISQLRQL